MLGGHSLSDRDASSRDAGLAASAAGLSLVVEPRAGIGPVLDLIAHAKQRVLMTIYELTDRRIEAALAAATARGVRVRVLLGRPWDRDGAQTLAYLRSHRIAARYGPPRFALTHQKSLEVDRKAALIMTFNLTPRYYASDRDFAILDRRPGDVTAIEGAFSQDWQEAGDSGRLPRQSSPGERPSSSQRLGGDGLLWSPGAAPRLLALIAGARRSLQLESEELSDEAVVTALCAAAQRGVRVQATLAYQAASQATLARLGDCGVALLSYPLHAPLYIHAKALVADGRIAFVGSQNLSTQSLDFDRELGIVFSAKPLVRALAETLARDFAGAYSIARRAPLHVFS